MHAFYIIILFFTTLTKMVMPLCSFALKFPKCFSLPNKNIGLDN